MIIISAQLVTRQEHKRKKDMKLSLVMSGFLNMSIKKNQLNIGYSWKRKYPEIFGHWGQRKYPKIIGHSREGKHSQIIRFP